MNILPDKPKRRRLDKDPAGPYTKLCSIRMFAKTLEKLRQSGPPNLFIYLKYNLLQT